MSELTFLDLIMLQKIDKDSAVEKFGTLINTSFFETANLLGGLKVKQMVEIETSIGGASPVTLTEVGKGVLLEADEQANKDLDALDNAILASLGRGVNELEALTTDLNILSKDLAYHLHKLVTRHYISYSVRSAKIYLSLTESGFNHIGATRDGPDRDIAFSEYEHSAVAGASSGSSASGTAAAASAPKKTPVPSSPVAHSSPGPTDWPSDKSPDASKSASPTPYSSGSPVSSAPSSSKAPDKGQQTTLQQQAKPKPSEPPFELPKIQVPVSVMRKLTKVDYYFRTYWYIVSILVFLVIAGFVYGAMKLLGRV